jgi:multicomponent Na+:H+ antiporter subunit G
MNWDIFWDTAALVLILIGALLCLVAAIGLLRFRDVPTRLHAATKPQVLGLVLIALAVGISVRSWPAVGMLVAIVLMQFATAPLSAHIIGRQAYRNRTLDQDSLLVDELADAQSSDNDD